jgi:hypothetical protein
LALGAARPHQQPRARRDRLLADHDFGIAAQDSPRQCAGVFRVFHNTMRASAMMWHALRSTGVREPIPGYGRLLTLE